MNTALILIILIPIIEIYLFIKIGSQIGALSTVLLIFLTAFVGLIYVRYEGFNTLKSAISQLVKNEIPMFEIMSGAALVIGAFLLILPGFLTDILGLFFVIPITRKIFFKKITSNYKDKKKNFIDGEYEDIDDLNKND